MWRRDELGRFGVFGCARRGGGCVGMRCRCVCVCVWLVGLVGEWRETVWMGLDGRWGG